jgi:hypothetical protein
VYFFRACRYQYMLPLLLWTRNPSRCLVVIPLPATADAPTLALPVPAYQVTRLGFA